MPYKEKMPLVGVHMMRSEEASLERVAKQFKLTKSEMARAFMRAGMQSFDPEKVLALAQVKSI
jgi:hypothetical protein